jgi:hypothetical protein
MVLDIAAATYAISLMKLLAPQLFMLSSGEILERHPRDLR